MTILRSLVFGAFGGWVLDRARRRFDSFWRPAPAETGMLSPLQDRLRRDPQTGEYVPESAAVRRHVNGTEHFFVSLDSYLEFRKRSRA